MPIAIRKLDTDETAQAFPRGQKDFCRVRAAYAYAE